MMNGVLLPHCWHHGDKNFGIDEKDRDKEFGLMTKWATANTVC